MDSGTVSAVVAIIGMLLSYLGASIDPALINGAVQGILGLVAFGAALWSWYSHTKKNATLVAAGLR